MNKPYTIYSVLDSISGVPNNTALYKEVAKTIVMDDINTKAGEEQVQ